MRANFSDFHEVPELGDAASYATRLRNYGAPVSIKCVGW